MNTLLYWIVRCGEIGECTTLLDSGVERIDECTTLLDSKGVYIKVGGFYG